jgi:eukaryotic-like serine/threonine-protein kinase
MTQSSVTHFLETVERSGLVDRRRLEEVLAALERETGPDVLRDTQVLSSHLTGRGLLTGWQSERLLEGRHRGFFLGKYKLLDHLGTGGMSSVYLAEHLLMRRRVAIKVLPTNRSDDSSRVRRFHREARAVAALDHPNIVRAFDIDQEGDVHFLVMEYIRGRDLKTLVEQDGPLPPRTAAEFVRQAAEGLAHAHRAGLVHRDMKPANLLVDHNALVKVLDLGLASVTNDIDGAITNEFDEKVLGTVDYLAPEQALNSHQVDGRADIYSLGCTLYFALSGRPPFGDGSLAQRIMAHQVREPADIRGARPEVPEALVRICRRMMAKSPGERYQSMEDVAAALAEWLRVPAAPPKGDTGNQELKLAPLDDDKRPRAPANPIQKPRPADKNQSASPRPQPGAKQPSGIRSKTPTPQPQRRQSPNPSRGAPRSPLDNLLAELPAAKPKKPGDNSGRNLSRPLGKSAAAQGAAKRHWDSPWYVIGIGAMLGVLLVLAYFAYRLFA